MKLGMVGLGRMGANMTRRLMRGGHELVVTDLSAENVKRIAAEGAIASASLDDFVNRLDPTTRAAGEYCCGQQIGPNISRPVVQTYVESPKVTDVAEVV